MAIYTEFENENRFRAFPFAEGSVLEDTQGNPLDTSMFIDAMLYPTNIHGRLRLTAIDFETETIEISDDDGVIGVGDFGETINVVSGWKNIGTIVTKNIQSTASLRREFNYLYFAASCVFDFNPAGVTGIKIGDEILTGKIVLEPSSTIVPDITENDGEYYLSLNVTSANPETDTPSIKTIFVMHSQGSIISVEEYNANSISVNLGNISRQDICNNAHREDSINIYDTCSDDGDTPDIPGVTPAVSNSFWMFNIGVGTDQAFNIITSDVNLVVNPINVQLIEGTAQPNLPTFTRNMTDAEADIEMKKLTSSNVTGNGVLLQIPGLI